MNLWWVVTFSCFIPIGRSCVYLEFFNTVLISSVFFDISYNKVKILCRSFPINYLWFSSSQEPTSILTLTSNWRFSSPNDPPLPLQDFDLNQTTNVMRHLKDFEELNMWMLSTQSTLHLIFTRYKFLSNLWDLFGVRVTEYGH